MSFLDPTALLDMQGVSSRRETFRFDVLDQSLAKVGELATAPLPSPPTIVNDVNRPIRRTLDSLLVPTRPLHERDDPRMYADDVDVIGHRIRPMHVLPGGTANPLGVFLWANRSGLRRSFGIPLRGSLVDQCVILEQRLIYGVGYDAGTVVSTALATQAAAAGLTSVSIESTATQVAAPNVWVSGRDTRLKVMEDLCALAGYLAPYFDNNGVLVCRSAPDLATATATIDYDASPRNFDSTIVESDDLIDAPNIYVALDTSGVNGEIVGTFEVPASAPHSFANRGFYVPAFVMIPGLPSIAVAQEAAAAAYAQDSATFKWLMFSSPIDSRHDTFDIISYLSENWREQSWRMSLTAGGAMEHTLRGIY